MSAPRAASAGGVADLTIQNDVQGELALRPAAMQTLAYMADRGGEIGWNWEGIKQATREMITDLIEGGLIVEREYLTHALQLNPPLGLRLTDEGRNVIAAHRQRKIVAGTIKPVEAPG